MVTATTDQITRHYDFNTNIYNPKKVYVWLYSSFSITKVTEWLFEVRKEDTHMTVSFIAQIFGDAKKRAGIKRRASFHTLRHSLASHVIEAGHQSSPYQIASGRVSFIQKISLNQSIEGFLFIDTV